MDRPESGVIAKGHCFMLKFCFDLEFLEGIQSAKPLYTNPYHLLFLRGMFFLEIFPPIGQRTSKPCSEGKRIIAIFV
jgi:hypothetical protein